MGWGGGIGVFGDLIDEAKSGTVGRYDNTYLNF